MNAPLAGAEAAEPRIAMAQPNRFYLGASQSRRKVSNRRGFRRVSKWRQRTPSGSPLLSLLL